MQNEIRGLTAKELRLSGRIKAIFEAGPHSQVELGKYLGLDQSHVSRLLNARSHWTMINLEKFCDLYNISPSSLMAEDIPICGQISALNDLKHETILKEMTLAQRTAPIPPDIDLGCALYVLEIEGNSYLHRCCTLNPGTLLYIRRAPNEICSGDMVVFVNEDGVASLRQVFLEKPQVQLKSLHIERPDVIRPWSYIHNLDRVVWMKLAHAPTA